MRQFSPKAPSRRQQRVEQELQHALSQVLNQELSMVDFPDDLSVHSITITHVDVSPDLRNARVFVTPLGGSSVDSQALACALNLAKGHMRRMLTSKVKLKYSPALDFIGDTSVEQVYLMEKKLREERVQADVMKA